MTTITTAARRITRTINAAPRGANIFFDADGVEVTRVYGRELIGPARSEYVTAAEATQTPMTYARAQSHIDAQAEARTYQPTAAEMAAEGAYLADAEAQAWHEHGVA